MNDEKIELYDLLADLAGENYSKQEAFQHMRLLVELSRSPFTINKVTAAIAFVERFTLKLSNLTSDEMAQLIELAHRENDDF